MDTKELSGWRGPEGRVAGAEGLERLPERGGASQSGEGHAS